ncbi:TIGR03986 family CRISPR-associated RAMP protein [Candidatus Chloroploca sp. Khr17]|uniref:TIGR03986 family type III CRISPR-associated RAMP protein n=1 Tax=Candidatus Chloroploca sp. Khr17 TaxID=2496869 RepID=UPI00101DC23B|nr:TIGR03986 family CRISPR-associated RAMP protein [Candidatus Chloroploca sp. Khr17]
MTKSPWPPQAAEIAPPRTAIAPYNFVPLPAKIVPAEAPERHDVYHTERHTGTITCTLTTESPLYVRCGFTPDAYAELAKKGFEQLSPEERQQRAAFFNLGQAEQPVIPGSSLRGMLRSLVEIAGYGKMERVTDKPRYFFRAVAAPGDDPLGSKYDAIMGKLGKKVRAGYVERDGSQWYIRPVQPLNGRSFIKIKEYHLQTGEALIPNLPGFKRFDDPGFQPQYIPCSFTIKPGENGIMIVQLGSRGSMRGGQDGVLVSGGNMLETADDAGRTSASPRKAHVIVPVATTNKRLEIDPQAIADYRTGLTTFQKDPPFDPEWGALIVERPIFYCEPPGGSRVIYFGHNPNFRLPYRPPGFDRAATPRDFVPAALRRAEDCDLAEAIFGFVRETKRQDEVQVRAGRIFVRDALLEPGQHDVFAEAAMPHVLASPKPTTFQHYLVQPDARKQALRHYASAPGEETVVRGHKLYWHKGQQPAWQMSAAEDEATSDTQKTLIRPVKPGTRFTFTIHIENLTDVELGAVLWVLHLAHEKGFHGKQYRLKLGMGKPLGLGAISLASVLQLHEPTDRYQHLFAHEATGLAWETGVKAERVITRLQERCLTAFNDYVLSQSGEQRPASGLLKDTLRMQCLLALLAWPGPQDVARQTRYMEIERTETPRLGDDENEYKERRVLPRPC